MSPVRVAWFLNTFEIGGTELNAVRTAEALDPRAIDLRVYYMEPHGPLLPRYQRLDVPMTHIPITTLYSPRTVAQGFRLAGLLRRDAVEVVHSHDIYGNIFAVPWARLLTTSRVIASRRWGRKASRPELARANHWGSAFAHRILTNSKAVGQMMADEEGVAPAKIVDIPNFLDDSAFEWQGEEARVAQRRAWGVPDGAFVVGIVARLAPVKNHAMLLEAAARLGERFHFVLVGDGPLRADLEAEVQRLGIASRVHFAGEVISPDNLHQHFDASVLCSVSEGFPNSVIEAMAAARPVVATPVGGVTDAIRDQASGLLVPVGDAGRLAEALQSLEADASLRARLGEAAREAARAKFHRQSVVERLTVLYRELARDRNTGARRITQHG